MQSVQLLAVAMGGMAVVFLVVAWRRGRRIDALESRVDRLESPSDRLGRLEQAAEDLDAELDELRPQRKDRRRRWRLIQGGAVAVPVALIVVGAVTAAVAVLDRNGVHGARLMPAAMPELRALPAEEAVPITPGEAVPAMSAMSAMGPPEAPAVERSTEIVSALPPSPPSGEQGQGGSGLSASPPGASPLPQPPVVTVPEVDLPDPLLPPVEPPVVEETDSCPVELAVLAVDLSVCV